MFRTIIQKTAAPPTDSKRVRCVLGPLGTDTFPEGLLLRRQINKKADAQQYGKAAPAIFRGKISTHWQQRLLLSVILILHNKKNTGWLSLLIEFNHFPTSQTCWCPGFRSSWKAFIKRFFIPDPPPTHWTISHPLPDHFAPSLKLYVPILWGWILKSCTFQVQTLIIPSSSGLIFSDLTKLLRSCRLYSCDRTPGDKKRITFDREINRKQFSFPIRPYHIKASRYRAARNLLMKILSGRGNVHVRTQQEVIQMRWDPRGKRNLCRQSAGPATARPWV